MQYATQWTLHIDSKKAKKSTKKTYKEDTANREKLVNDNNCLLSLNSWALPFVVEPTNFISNAVRANLPCIVWSLLILSHTKPCNGRHPATSVQCTHLRIVNGHVNLQSACFRHFSVYLDYIDHIFACMFSLVVERFTFFLVSLYCFYSFVLLLDVRTKTRFIDS